MISQGGSRRSRVVNQTEQTDNTEDLKKLDNDLNELKGYRNNNKADNSNELDTGQSEIKEEKSSKKQRKSQKQQQKPSINNKEEDDEEVEESGIEKVSNGLSRLVKVLAVGFLAIIVIAIVGCIISSRKSDAQEAKRYEYEQYLEGYITALKTGEKNTIDNYFGGESLIGEEFEYFQDGAYKDNSLALLKAILSTVEFDYALNVGGRPDTGLTTNVDIKYIDYSELAESVFMDAKGIEEGAKAVMTKTQLDKQILKNYCLGYLAEKITNRKGNAKSSFTVNISEIVNKDKSVTRYINSDLDSQIESLLFESDTLYLSYRIMTDAIKGKIEAGMGYSEYIANLDKEKLTEGYSDENNYIKDNQFGVLAKQADNVSKICGDGTSSNMATVGTEVQSIYKATVKKKNKKGKTKKVKKDCKVLVTINEVYAGDSAIVYANSVSNLNRGLSSNLTGKLMIIDYTISNLSDYTFKVENNMGVVDAFGNRFYSTGKIHGLKDSGTLKKKGSLNLQFYILCDNLETKYLVYGVNFNRKHPYVWFNCIEESFGTDEENTENMDIQEEEVTE